ncbi:unnamed protein product [Linum tenue]|uniref:Uncharacterized protein n=1 Tax=Linum tenue TaxID=586396 RepID=A0AAV0RG89_9ROSI|nr:unnamed protein product [Linum tenue]
MGMCHSHMPPCITPRDPPMAAFSSLKPLGFLILLKG